MSRIGLCICSISKALEYGFKESDFSGHAPRCEAYWQRKSRPTQHKKEYQRWYYQNYRKLGKKKEV